MNTRDLSSLGRRGRGFEARPSELLLALVRRARWLWLGWLEARWNALRGLLRARRARQQRPQGSRFETLEPKLLLSGDLMPLQSSLAGVLERQVDTPVVHGTISPVGMAHALGVQAPSSAPLVVVTGPGSGSVVAQGGGYLLQLTGTTSLSSVSLVSGAQVALTGISADSAVGTLSLANADLSGNASFAGSVGTLTLGQVSHANISVAGGAAFTLNAGQVSDSVLLARSATVALNVASWSASAAGASRVEAAAIKSLTTTGDMAADVFVSGVGVTGYALTTVQVGGAISGGLWSVHGRGSSITAGSTAAAWRMNISGPLVQLLVKGDASGDLALASLQLLQVTGSTRGLHLLVGANLGDDAALGGTGANADSFQAGTLARVRVGGDMVDTYLIVSVDPVNGVFFDGNDRQLGTAVQRLQELTVNGKLLGSTAVVAPMFPTTVSIGGLSVNPATLPQLGNLPPDRIPPVLTSFGLDPASDSAPVGDGHTTINPVDLIGMTEAGAALTLRRAGSSTVLGTAVAAADGSFRFSGIALDLGANAFVLTLADAAGNTSTGNLTVTRDAIPDTTPPTLSAALANDTGASASDGITSDPTISGNAHDDVGVTHLLVALDPGATPSFTDLIGLLQANGSFTLSRAALDTLAGGKLADGAHVVRVVAKDAAGNASTPVDIAFRLDTQAPVVASFGLDPASDSPPVGDGHTTINPVNLVGMTEAGAALTLRLSGSSTVLGTAVAAADGSFHFSGISLSLGANAFVLTLADAAGNTSTSSLTLTRDPSTAADTLPPTLSAALAHDTGISATDGITSDPTIAGDAHDDVGVTHLLVALDPGATPSFTDLVGLLQANGSFTLSRAVLDTLAGGKLADGAHVVRVVAKDAAGNASTPVDVAFKLDTQAPTGASFGIGVIDALAGNDAQTGSAIVTLQGLAEAGATITLAAQGLSSTADASGRFQLPGVALALGDNSITLSVADAAGNAQTVARTLTRVATTQTDPVLEWTNIALKAIQSDATDPPVATRVLALQSISVYDTLAAIQGTPAFLVQRSVSGNVDAYAAVEQAAYRVLYQLYPAQRAGLDAGLAADLAKITDGAAKTAGIALGDGIARAVIALRANDGYLTLVNIDGSSALGAWRPTGPGFAVAQDPQWGAVTPFALTSGSEFRAPAPPALTSPEYAAAINQVQSLGRATNSTRTADQTQQALFWADGGGSYTPPGHWDAIATQIAAAKGNSLSANARLMAQLNVALADAAIAAWDTKYTYDFWRPVTAIQNADLDNNAATTVDPNWTSFLITPPHPSYVSGHSTFSAAAAGILAATFGDNTAFSTTSPTLPGVTRSFASFSQAADEAGMSRIYGGIHTSLDNNAGKLIGAEVAQAVLARFALTQDKQPPKILLGATPAATHTNPVISGQVIDNLSGVAGAQISVDGGAPQSLTLDANGSFSFSPGFALDGSADGGHTLAIVATDKAGNVSAPTTISLTLDTKAPALVLSSIADGASLVAGSRLSGSADGTGSSLTLLNYSIDGGSSTAIAFTPGTGAFDQALNLANLGVGNHTLTLSASDAAGNSATLTRQVKVNSLPLLTVASLSPTDGSTDVGSTYRPKLVFSRAVNTATLTSDSFYATGPDGSKIAASIVPAADGSYAWLFFTAPLPGGARITIHVVGASIRGASDGSFLDAAGSGLAGSSLTTSFTTVSLASVLGTKLVGRVVDPGPDLVPGTFDDVRRGPDGILHTADDVYLNPIANAKVTILGTGQVVYTDATGYFEFDNAPTGDVKLAVDGRTATNPPTGVFWPEMVMDLTLRAGITNTAMGSMGSLAVQQANSWDMAVYLPRVPVSTLQTVAADVPTVITTPQVAAPKLTDEQRNSLTLTVQPGSAVGNDGQPLGNVQIGMATVPPELVKDMLPAGVAEHSFDITIQAPGVAVFTKPVQITFPNVFNAAPGTQLDVLSFDHTTGRLVINGTATVSADGKTVVSDPGSGIVAPGWHGLTPPGAPSDPPCPPATHDIDVTPVLQTSGIQDYFFPKDSGTMNLSFANNAAKLDPNSDACSTTNVHATPLLVEVTLDDASAGQFLDGVHQQTFSLEPQQVGNINGTVHALLGQISTYSADRLYGLKIHMHTHWVDKNGVDHNLDGQMPATDIYAYRFLDIADNRHEDGKIDFPRIAAGVGFTQKDGLTYYGDPAAKPQNIAVGTGTNFSVAGDQIQFTPTTTGTLNDLLTITAPDAKDVGKINLSGVGLALQNVFFSQSEFSARIAAVVDASPVVAGTQRLVDMFPDTDGDGSRTTGVDKPFFDATVAQLFNDITVQFYVTMLGVDPASLSTLTLVNGTPGTGDKVNLRNVAIGGAPYTGSAAAVWADFGIDYFLSSIVPNEANMSKPQIQYLFDGLFNRSVSDNSGSAFVPGGSGLIVNVDKMVAGAAGAAGAGAAAFRSTLVNQFASTIGHEFGHLLGAIHQRTNTAPYSSNYLMGLGTLLTTIPAIGPDFIGVFKAGLGIPSTVAEFQAAYNYYKLQANNDYTVAGQAYAFNNGGNPVPGPGHLIDEGDLPAYLAVVDGPADNRQPPNVVGSLDFGTVNADGPGGALASKTVWLFNTGNHPLHLSSVDVQGNAGFSVSGFSGPLDLAAFDPNNPAASRLAVTVTFDPSALGSASAKLHIVSNSSGGASTDIPLAGKAVSPYGHLAVSVPNNNVGGTKVGSTGAVANFGTLTNDGTQPLSITQALSNSPDFAVTGALAGVSAATPLVLAPGASVQFGVTFTPAKISLDRAAITISSNDPTQATFTQALVGTGLAAQGTALHYGNDYIELDQPNSPNLPPLRMVSGPDGQWSFFLPPSTPVHYTIFDPVSGLVAEAWDTTAPSGKTTMFTQANFRASTAPDTNGNGLPDNIKFAIGTNPNSQDTNHDGISDFDSIRLGINPLGSLGAPTGVLSSAALTGSAEAVAVSAAVADPSHLTAYVATGSRGLSVVDVTNFTKPAVLAEISLPGNNVDIAVDGVRGVAAVAGGDAGLSLVDISKPAAPVLMQTVAFGVPVNAVQVRDGIAFVATGNDLAVVNLLTGDLLQSVNLTTLGGSTVTSLSIDGSTLYSVDASHTLRSFAISGSQLTVLGSLALPAGGGRLFVGNGVAYIGASNGGTGGFATADVSNPAAMTVLSGVKLNSIGGTSVVPNGSGLAVAVGSSSFVFGGFKALDLMNVSDPTNTGTLVTRYNLPAVPRDVVIANGLAFVADSTGGLQIVNYVAFDAKGVPPQVVSLQVDAKDADPGTPGVQVLEGRSFTVRPTVADDVQVRNVELLVDGVVVADAPAFPFVFTAQTPTIAAGGNKLSVQVRVTDTGGNSTLSAPVVFDVVKDTFPPVLQSVSVDEGARRFFVKSVDFSFDEPLDTSRLTTAAISLVRPGPDGVFGTADDVSVPVSLNFRSLGQVFSVLPGGYLPPGDYQLTVKGSAISDKAGNILGTDLVRHFTIRPASDVRATSGAAAVATAPSANPGQQIGISVPFDPSTAKANFQTIDANGVVGSVVVGVFRFDAARGIAYFNVPLNAYTGDCVVYGQVGSTITNFADGTFPLQIVPIVTGLSVQSVSSDGTSATVVLYGRGFVEGNNSLYRLGTTSVLD
ncbi:choice-of-anchor D domain-containing protein, partial [Pelomonas aquatica]